MRKSKLSNGTPFIGIKVEHYVTINDFTKHLAEHFHRKRAEFNIKLGKRQAMKILKRGLFFNGLEGEIDTTLYESSPHGLDHYEAAYVLARKWVEINYPYLIK